MKRATGVARRRGGFTLVEMLVVIATIAFLMAVLAIMVGKVQQQSQDLATRRLIDGLEAAMVSYYDLKGAYPNVGYDPVNHHGMGEKQTRSAMLYIYLTSEQYGRCLPEIPQGSIMKMPWGTSGGTDYTNYPYFADAWRNPIHILVLNEGSTQAGSNGNVPLIWSDGPNGLGFATSPTASMSADALRTAITAIDANSADNITNYRDIPWGDPKASQ